MTGSVIRRGKASWRIKFDLESDGGRRQTKYTTVRGSRRDAERELTRLLGTAHAGTYVEQSQITVAEYVRSWLDNAHSLAASTLRRYRDLSEAQVIPFLGQVQLQRLKPAHIENWHSILLTRGGKDGAPLAARTCGHAHKVLHLALARAVRAEVIARNVAAVIKPPKVDESEVQILRADQIGIVTAALDGHWLKPMVMLALATGMRRGEILALTWGAVDLDKASIRIERSLEQTKEGLAFRSPKTKASKRTVSLPPTAVEVLREHRRQQLETRLQLGQGKPTLIFSNIEGEAIPPMNFSRDFARFVKAPQLPCITFHGLRHTHVSALISAGVDVLTISRRIGHANAAITLKTYSHLFAQNDSTAVDAIEAALRGKP
jgi:integrase